MRLTKIHIIHFGQLSDLTFDLPSQEIDVFFGKNEAGKSTTVAFIKQVMFGFYLRSNSSPFFEDYKPLAQVSPMGGSLFFEDQDQVFELERLWAKGDKTKRGILTVKLNGKVVPEKVFFDRIGQIDGDFYADTFIFNQEMLGQIASLSQKDLLERIYHLGASDSAKLLDLRDDFAKEAANLFKKTGRKPEVNRLLTELGQKRAEYQDSQAEFSKYQDLQAEFSQEKKQLEELDGELKALANQKQAVNKLAEEFKNYQQLTELKKQVEKVDFNSENYQKAQDLAAKIDNLKQEIASLNQEMGHLTENDFDQKKARQLLQEKAQLLQWQAELKQLEKDLQQNQLELEQQKLNLGALAILAPAEFEQMVQSYKNLPQELEEPEVKSNNFWLTIGVVVAGVGLAGLFVNRIFGILLLVLGAALAGIGYVNKQKLNAKKAAQLNARKARLQQIKAFEDKYQVTVPLNLAEIISQYQIYRFKQEQLVHIKAEGVQVKEQLAAFKDQVAAFLNKPVDDVLAALNEIDDQLSNFKNQAARKEQLALSLKTRQQHLAELNLQLKAVMAQDHVEKISDYQDLYQKKLKQAEIQTQIASLQNSLADVLPQLEKTGLKDLNEKQEALKQKTATLENDRVKVQSKLAQEQVKLDNLADSNVIFTKKQELANKTSEFLNSSKEYLANLLAAKLIERALDIASNRRFPKMLKTAKQYLNFLTGGRYVDLNLDKKLTVTRFDGKKREVKYLSRATSEQLYFALKFAFASQIADQINLPILIDDSFVNFDDQRIGYIKELLAAISEHNQVLIFTAQENLVKKLAVKALTFEKGSN